MKPDPTRAGEAQQGEVRFLILVEVAGSTFAGCSRTVGRGFTPRRTRRIGRLPAAYEMPPCENRDNRRIWICGGCAVGFETRPYDGGGSAAGVAISSILDVIACSRSEIALKTGLQHREAHQRNAYGGRMIGMVRDPSIWYELIFLLLGSIAFKASTDPLKEEKR